MTVFIPLYFVGFARTLLVIAIIYFGIRFIKRYVLPLLIDKGIKTMQQKMQEQQRNNQPSRPEGDVTVEGRPGEPGKKPKDNGEYVDFEEVE